MATSLKTTEWWFPLLQAAVEVTDTNFTQISVFRPETVAANPFKSVFVEVVFHDKNTSLGNYTRRQLSLQLGAAGYSAVNNTSTLTNGGEQQTILMSADFTAYFNTNWSGTSMTCDLRVLCDHSNVSTPLGTVNHSARLVVTYEYDDTSTTQIKTVRIPLNAPVGALATTKPGSATDTIPALDTEFPEASKTYRQRGIVVQGNNNAAATTDTSVTIQVDTDTALTSTVYEEASNVAMFVRVNSIESFTTNATHGFYLWASLASWHHMQAYLVVTYEFDASAANDVYVSLMLPMEVDSPMGGPTSADYQRAKRDLMIQEPGTITQKSCAALIFWDQLGAIAGLNIRIGTGSFVAYTDAAVTLGGSNAAMVRNDSAFTLARGRNSLNLDVYRTDTTDIGYNIGVAWLVNYTCGKPTGGHGRVNHTVLWGEFLHDTAAAAVQQIISATAIGIPESDHYKTSIGMEYKCVPSGTVAQAGQVIQVERLSGEGGLVWEPIYGDLPGTDGETGIYTVYATARTVFQRWTGDTVDGNTRLDIETSRRYRMALGNSVAAFHQLVVMITYHSITFTVGGTVSGSGGGTVTLTLCRASSGERLMQTTRSGNGAYSFTCYDNTEDVYVDAYEGAAYLGRSDNDTATGTP